MRPISSSKQRKRLRAINRRIVCGILLYSLLTLIGSITGVSASAYGGTATSTFPGKVANAGFLNTPNSNKPDLAITKTNIGGFNFLVGQQITYYLNVSNGVHAGPVLASGPITVTDDIPAGLTSVTPTGTDWSFVQTDSNVTATYTGTYPVVVGQTLPEITLTGTLTADGLGQLTNTARVSTPYDSNPSNNTSRDTIMLNKKPDLWIIKTNDGGDTFEIGQQVTYHLVVQDVAIAGPVLAPGPITVTEDIPSGLIVNSMSGKHWSFSQISNTITINYTGAYPIKPGQTLPTITIKGTLTVDGVGQLTNTATVTTPNEYSLQNNTAQDTINVALPPDLSIVKTTKEGDSYYAGQAIHYLLKVKTNQFAGQALASDPVVVKDDLPIGLNHVKLSGLHWSFRMIHRKVIATYKGSYPVPSGTQLPTITIGARLTNQALPLTVNTAHVGTVLHPDTGNSSTKTVVVHRSPDLELTKTNTGGSYFLVGQTIHYHLSVHNLSIAAPLQGPGPITVIDYIPEGLDRVSGSGHDWRVEVTPTRVIATYTGAYPVRPGTTLPTITITGTFTSAAIPFVVNKASVKTPRDFIADNDRAQRKVHVRPAPGLPPTGSGPNETTRRLVVYTRLEK